MTSFRLDRILETVLYADDLEAAEHFYRDVLGLQVDSRKDGVFVFFRLQDAMLLLFRAEAARANDVLPAHGAAGSGHACFAVPERELDGWKERLERQGVRIEHEQAWPRGSRSFYFRDPAGNSLEIASPLIWGMADLRGPDATAGTEPDPPQPVDNRP
ncbi:MAG TPA: VOC family protein [Geminicoccus sp.]|uniref:VOC family protein n=1 Tax=Geminicoccus sp. TaxID=2024832 RepID=UPI002C8F9ECB|nr:VOC family protein [Geminicoccus sp.]HWL70630.1 VOC family protein [Geminicoccus sp.]